MIARSSTTTIPAPSSRLPRTRSLAPSLAWHGSDSHANDASHCDDNLTRMPVAPRALPFAARHAQRAIRSHFALGNSPGILEYSAGVPGFNNIMNPNGPKGQET